MILNEAQLRRIIRDEILLRESSGKIYVDNDGYKFRIDGGKLMLVARPAKDPNKQSGLPKQIQPKILASTVQNLITYNGEDPALRALLGSPGAKVDAKTSETPTVDFQIMPKLQENFPNITAAMLIAGTDVVVGDSGGIPDCSKWAKGYVGRLGNAWHAHDTGNLKFDAYQDFSKYKASVESLLSKMNEVPDLNDTSATSFNATANAISSKLVPSAGSIVPSMQLGDVVGLYYPKSSHHAEAIFDSACGFSLARQSDIDFFSSPAVTVDGGESWDESMIGQKKKFTLNGPIGFNTHIGFVGAMYKGQPIVFHNSKGTILAGLASKMTNSRPVWVKPSGFVMPDLLPDLADVKKTASDAISSAEKTVGQAYDYLKGLVS